MNPRFVARLSCILVPLALGMAGCTDVVTTTENSSLAPARYLLPDSGFELQAPEGFTVKKGIFYHEPYHTTFHFAHADKADYKTVAAEFTEESVNKEGKKLIQKQEVKVGGTEGLLIEIHREKKEGDQIMWTAVFPDNTGVNQVSVIIRKDQPQDVLDAMKTALLTVRRTAKD